jgi:GAF domain-containing protein
MLVVDDTRGGPLTRIAATKKVVHIPNILAERLKSEGGDPRLISFIGFAGARSVLGVPMLEDNVLIGAAVIYRHEVRPFTDKQIELVKNFAAQAVIAIENTRLLNELRQRTSDLTESLEQQTATSEVLKVISSSPGELNPVFQAMLDNAARVCEANFGNIFLLNADAVGVVASLGEPQALSEFFKSGPHRPHEDDPVVRAARAKEAVHVIDFTSERAYIERNPLAVAGAELGGIRTLLVVPMLKGSEFMGAIALYRREVRSFNEKQIALVQNFAAQAVIAIENTRLLNELRQRTSDLSESLEQQTATAEVLQVISSSPGDLQPVFQSMLENAVRICDAKFGILFRYDNEAYEPVALFGLPPALEEFLRQQRGSFQPIPGSLLDRIRQTKQLFHTADYSAEAAPGRAVTLGGARSTVDVPMLKAGLLIGVISIYRQEVRPFTGKQIELVKNFAAQAVIAIENTRLLNELRESLEQQTATADVLKVISSSPGELKPVFDAMLENAVRICDAKFGFFVLHENGQFRIGAMHNVPRVLAEIREREPLFHPGPMSPLVHAADTKELVHVTDFSVHPSYQQRDPPAVRLVELAGVRTLVVVPMLKENAMIGAIIIYRTEIQPFADKQIELVKNFAAQAVIAIENTRLLNELRQRTNDLTESLEQQTATSEVLKVISSSPGELEPVFQTMLGNAVRICDAKFGTLYRIDNATFAPAAEFGLPPALAAFHRQRGSFRPAAETPLGRLLRTKDVVRIADDMAGSAPGGAAKFGGARSLIVVPMLRENVLIGGFSIYRQEVRPFTGKQIDLVKNFAAQAVIAIENTRLLNDLRQRTTDLTESLEQQTATSEVLQVISSSPGELGPVFATMLEKAVRICDAKFGNIYSRDGDGFYLAATLNTPPAFAEYRRQLPIGAGTTTPGRMVTTKAVIHVADLAVDPNYDRRHPETVAAVELGGVRTFLAVPMLKDDKLIGALALSRQEIRPFTDKQIALVENFAAQAVIAIENARLLNEIQDKSRQLEVASQHKSQFLANMSHELRTPLNAILGYTELMADGIYGQLPKKTRDVLKRLESNGKHLLSLINDVLDLSKIEAGQLVLELSDYSLEDIAATVRSTLEPLAADKKLVFKVEVAPKLPAGHGDGRRLTQVLINLVGNAIKFTDAGEVVIKVAAPDGSFHVSVCDTGPGISAADQAKLFQEFQQADNAITRKKGGTGLGLAISKRIIEMHGGKIWVESQVGQGSTFLFTVPVRVVQQVETA